MRGRRSTNPTRNAVKVCFFCCHNFLEKQIPRATTTSGTTIRELLNVFIAKTKDTAENTIHHFFSCKLATNVKIPTTKKNVATFASKPARESIICHGDKAKTKAAQSA